MGFWDSAKKKAQQAQLQGQILFTERQLQQLQHSLGVDIFSLVFGFAQAQERTGDDGAETSSSSNNELMESIEELPAIFHAAFEDVRDLVQRRADADTQRDRLETQETPTAGSWMSAAGSRARLTAEIVYIDREILLRKQIFGTQVATELNLIDRDLTACPNNELVTLLQKYQSQAQSLLRQKKDYKDQIALLSGNRPTENRSLVVPDETSEDNFVAQQDHSESTSMTDEYL